MHQAPDILWLNQLAGHPQSSVSQQILHSLSLENVSEVWGSQGWDCVPFLTISGCRVFSQSLTLWKPQQQCLTSTPHKDRNGLKHC